MVSRPAPPVESNPLPVQNTGGHGTKDRRQYTVGTLGRLLGIDRILDSMEMNRMSLATDIKAAADEVGASAQAAAERVTAAVGGLRTQLTEVQAQLQALIDAGSADAVELEAALTTLRAADAVVDSIEPAPVEPPVEPPLEG
jgi:hypothetical protein